MNKFKISNLMGFIGLLSFFGGIVTQATAGQVVTDSERQWAKQAIAREKSNDMVQSEKTLGILYFHNKTSNKELRLLQKGLTFMLITDLSKIEGFQLVERVKLQALLEELALDETGLISTADTERVCRLLQANYILGGEIEDSKNQLSLIRASLLNIKKEKTAGQLTVEGKLLKQLFAMEKRLVFNILKMLKIQITDDQKTILKKPLTTNLDAFINLVKGLEASDQKKYAQALEFYQAALALDPDIEAAKNAIEEIKSLGLAGEGSLASELLKSIRTRTSRNNQIPVTDPESHPNVSSLLNNGQDSRVTVDW